MFLTGLCSEGDAALPLSQFIGTRTLIYSDDLHFRTNRFSVNVRVVKIGRGKIGVSGQLIDPYAKPLI